MDAEKWASDMPAREDAVVRLDVGGPTAPIGPILGLTVFKRGFPSVALSTTQSREERHGIKADVPFFFFVPFLKCDQGHGGIPVTPWRCLPGVFAMLCRV